VSGPLQGRHAAEGALAVHEQRPLAPAREELDLVAREAGHVDDLDPPAGDGPEGVVAAHSLGTVGRAELALERGCEWRETVGAVVDDEIAVGEGHEARAAPFDLGCVDRHDRVPFARPMEAVDAALVPGGPDRRRRPFERNAGLAREPDVQRLTPAEERHAPLWWAVRRRGSSVRFSR